MQGFRGPAVIELLPDGFLAKVWQPMEYEDSNGRIWTVPAGFTTNMASIPQALWSIVGSPYTGLYRIPAIFHDMAYGDPTVVHKEYADLMLRDFSLFLGCPHALAELVYTGVRFGGATPFTEGQYDAAIALRDQWHASMIGKTA